MPHVAAFSFDIEDWYHSQLIPARERHDHGVSVVRGGTEVILDLLAKHRIRGTFFVLGDVIREHPDIARRMVDEGHELGCHGMDHQPLWRLTPESLRGQLVEFRRVVEQALGHFPVVGFRAPVFSLDRSTAWALEVLRDQGYRYDSSVFPAKVKLYGVAGAPVGIYRPSRDDLTRHDPQGGMVEFPVAVRRLGPLRLPVGGGFYLRALPLWMFRRSLDHILEERPLALYLHPREVVPETRRLRLDPVNALITYLNLHTVRPKLERLFARYEWVTMREALERAGQLGTGGGAAR
jgi:polysaccharide deacetylase family protein (PEP-CTERM system associated)